jgi:hypothetical protein
MSVRRVPSRVFARGGRLYGKVKDVDGIWRQVATGFPVGEEDAARRWIADLEWQVMTHAPIGAPSDATARWYSGFADPVKVLVVQTMEAMRYIDRLCFPDGDIAPDAGYVYAIQARDGGPIKIGKAAAPADRLAGIQRMNPAPLVLLGLAHGDAEERHLHDRYMKRRLHGEWFAIDENPLPIGGTCLTCSPEWRAERIP